MKTKTSKVTMTALVIASLISPGVAVLAMSEPRPARDAHLAVSFAEPAMVNMLRGNTAAALDAFANAEADAEVGQDLGMDLAIQATAKSTGDPGTLAEYCAAPTPEEVEHKLGEGTRVKANWEGYGTMYPGKVKETNKDGTVDVEYDDGFTEKNVDPDEIKIRKKQNKLLQLAKAAKDDPACKLQDFLKKLQDQLAKLNEMMSQWLSGQRAKMANEDMPKPPATVTAAPARNTAPGGISAGAPAAAPSANQEEELEKLKAQLADLDAYIKELEAKEKEYDEKIAEKTGAGNAAPAPAAGVKTVDDLIAEYMAKIAERQARVAELLARITQQQEELAALGESQMSLADIDAAVVALEKDVEEGKKKRDELKKSGELDPELRAVIDDIIEALSKLRKKIDNLIALQAKAEAERKAAEAEEKAAEEEARRKAREAGENEEEAAAAAGKAAKKRTKEKRRAAELEAMKAAKEVEKDLEKAGEGANKLDTGLHPHGAKWWRYRYEHSHIEAMIMIFISFLMLLWSEFWRHMKKYVANQSLAPGVAPRSALEDAFEEAHGTILVQWLHNLADQMLVCIFVFLTVWLIAKTPLVDLFPEIITRSDDMRVPLDGETYRRLALDICTIFFFAIAFYFALMFSVAHAIRDNTAELEVLSKGDKSGRGTDAPKKAGESSKTLGASAMGSLTKSAAQFQQTRAHFVGLVQKQLTERDDPELKEIGRLINDDFNNFPLPLYLKINVRMTGSKLFLFSWAMWIPNICLFLCLLVLHRYNHMGYIRIMAVATTFVFLMIIGMGYITKSLVKQIESDEDAEHNETKAFHEKWNTEGIFLCVLQFALFFVCYGTARMICQPWMWELHFWPVLYLTLVAILSATLFVLVVAPAIPTFLCIMALPPYIDCENIKVMKQCAIEQTKPRSPAPTPRV